MLLLYSNADDNGHDLKVAQNVGSRDCCSVSEVSQLCLVFAVRGIATRALCVRIHGDLKRAERDRQHRGHLILAGDVQTGSSVVSCANVQPATSRHFGYAIFYFRHGNFLRVRYQRERVGSDENRGAR